MVIIFSVIFNANLPYFSDFIKSLEHQSFKNFKLVLINDGVINIEKYFVNIDLEYEIYKVKELTPFEIRIFGLKIVLDLKPEYIIFADSDDTFSLNRVEVLIKNLENYPFVCNDLDLIDVNGVLIEETFWSKRIGEYYEFDIQFLKNKNILGFGNSGMQFWPLKKMLFKIENFEDGNDWLFFTCAENDLNGLFVSDCRTNYRQHNNNIIGRKLLQLNSLISLIENKSNHYFKLKSIGFKAFDVDEQINEIKNATSIISNKLNNINNQLKYINSLNINFFWWEELNYLKLKKNEKNSIK